MPESITVIRSASVKPELKAMITNAGFLLSARTAVRSGTQNVF